jgi:hypothetical protein
MHHAKFLRLSVLAVVAAVAGLAAWPAAGAVQRVVGKASGVRATKIRPNGEATTMLAYTGPLGDAGDAREATIVTGSVPATLTGEVLRAVTVGWPDQVDSEASLANLSLAVSDNSVTADFLMASATASLGSGRGGFSIIDNLSINGVPVQVTGEPNQTIRITGGRLVINEQLTSGGAITVNALHVIVSGTDDVAVASATAGIR